MKKILLAFAFVSIFSTTFAQKTALELLNDKIYYTIDGEIPKYSDFGSYHILRKVAILDVNNKDNILIVDGEFSFTYGKRSDRYGDFDIRTFKFQANVKQILDDFSVIKIIYQKPNEKQWYRLFPANKFENN